MTRSVADIRSDLAELRRRIAVCEGELTIAEADTSAAGDRVARPLDERIHASNPHSRLIALKMMKVVPNFDDIRQKVVVIIGVGGVGSVVADMLARCALRCLILFDRDTVEPANLNRLFFTPSHVGMSKTVAVASALAAVAPEVQLIPRTCDISSLEAPSDGGPDLETTLLHGHPDTHGPVDLILCCVDNYAARVHLNRLATRHRIAWMESGVSEDAMSGHIQTLIPGATACFECVPPLAVAVGMDERTILRDGVCAASLPTTTAIVAGLLAHNALKFMLRFGRVAYWTGVASMTNHVYSDVLRPSETCGNADCRSAQAERAGWTPYEADMPPAAGAAVPLHDDNEWGITVDAASARSGVARVASGPSAEAAAVVDLPAAMLDLIALQSQLSELSTNSG